MQIVDYRNAKFQGTLNEANQRNNFGVLIDDDLSFYISNWKDNRLNASTLVYIAHGKYIYGEWKDNYPNGLNVFRCGDTVILGVFKRGKAIGRVLVIFERFNFITVLDDVGQDCCVVDRGYLKNHQSLQKYIELLEETVPYHYLSLTKFACSISNLSNNTIRTYPCGNSHCYFGFVNGLAIIFNSNNGVVSVGTHANEQLIGFGGKFNGSKSLQYGNFEPGGEIVAYTHDRPINKIYSIFQKIHKRSLNFSNQYFDSKVKILNDIYYLLRGKIKDIATGWKRDCNFSIVDLNDSLDYQYYDEQSLQDLLKNRENMYNSKKKLDGFKKKTEKVYTKNSCLKIEVEEKHNKFFKKSNVSIIPYTIQCQNYHMLIEESTNKYRNKSFVGTEIKKSRCGESGAMTSRLAAREVSPSLRETMNSTITITSRLAARYITPSARETTPSLIYGKYAHKSMSKSNSRYINASPNDKSARTPIMPIPASRKNQIYKYDKPYEYLPQSCLKGPHEEYQYQAYRVPTFKGLLYYKYNNNPSSRYSVSPISRQTRVDDHKILTMNPTISKLVAKYSSPINSSQIMTKSRRQIESKDVSLLARPSYEDIEERRKRLYKDYEYLQKYKIPEKVQLLCQNHRVFESPCHNLTFSTINDNDLNNLNHLPISHGRGHVEDVKKNHLVEKLLDQGQGPIKTSFSFCKQNVDSKKGESGNRTTESPNKYLYGGNRIGYDRKDQADIWHYKLSSVLRTVRAKADHLDYLKELSYMPTVLYPTTKPQSKAKGPYRYLCT